MSESEEEDYDAIRQRNIAELQAVMNSILAETEEDREVLKKAPESPKPVKKKPCTEKTPKVYLQFRKKYETRYSTQRGTRKEKKEENKEDDDDDYNNDDASDSDSDSDEVTVKVKNHNTRTSHAPKRKLTPYFADGEEIVNRDVSKKPKKNKSTRKKNQRKLISDSSSEESEYYDETENNANSNNKTKDQQAEKIKSLGSDDDEDLYSPYVEYDENFQRKKRKIEKVVYDPNNILMPDEVTQEMLDSVIKVRMDREYDLTNGTICHQCRQKTKDFKTICRSGTCVGTRGHLCGVCLQDKYKESAVEALKNPKWSCPSCRGICICKICIRNKNK